MPGGTCRDLSERARGEIARRWPTVDGEAINAAAKTYQVRLQYKGETPKNVVKTMDKVVKAASNLRLQLGALSEEADTLLWYDFRQSGQEDVYSALPSMLLRLQHAAMRGHNAELGRDGRKTLGPRHWLVAAVAWQLGEAGLKADKRPTGDLCRIVEVVLDDLGEGGTDVTSTVDDALKNMARNDHPGES